MNFINQIILGDCREYLPKLPEESIDLFLSDIPYGINFDEWDILHNNTNSALLGQSPAQKGKSGFKRRGKPINGWSKSDRNMSLEYQKWCESWVSLLYPLMKPGSSLFVFGGRRTLHRVVSAFEDSGFLVKDILAWKKSKAHHRAQRISKVLRKRELKKEAKKWKGWRLGNLAPIWEPIAWFMKPYPIGGTLTDNVLEHSLGALNIKNIKTNLLEFDYLPEEEKLHEAQKPIELIKFLISLVTIEDQVVIDPFMGSGTTALASKLLNRKYIGFEINNEYYRLCVKRLTGEKQ